MANCDHYWAYADKIPLSDVITYWCEKSGFNAEHCKAAKRGAIVSACTAGLIEYGRLDGKTFNDPPEMLAGMNVLTVDRKSFDKWVTDNFEDESPLPDKPLSPRERGNLLNIIGAMLELIQTSKPGRDSDSAVIQELLGNYSDKPGIKERTLQEKFAAAKRSLLSN